MARDLKALLERSHAIAKARQDMAPETLEVVMLDPAEASKVTGQARGDSNKRVVTAFWNPVGPAAHRISVLTDAFDHVKDDTEWAKWVELVLRHEAWHARVSDPDVHFMEHTAHYYGISPAVVNVFEDARIEAEARWTEFEDFGYFSKTAHGPTPLSHKAIGAVNHPLDMFQYLSMCEGYYRHEQAAKANWNGEGLTTYRGRQYPTVALIHKFVVAAQQATSTRHLWSLMLAFIEAFPQFAYRGGPEECEQQAQQDGVAQNKGLGKFAPDRGGRVVGAGKANDGQNTSENGKGNDGKGDGEGEGEGEGNGQGKDGKNGEDGKKPGGVGFGGRWDPKDTRPPELPPGFTPPQLNFKKADDPTTKVDDSAGIKPFLGGNMESGRRAMQSKTLSGQAMAAAMRQANTAEVDMTHVDAVAGIIRRLVGFIDTSRVRTSVMGSRLHMPNIMTGQSDAFRHNVTRKGRRKVVVIMDMSGSMGTSFADHGAAFLGAMVKLDAQNVMDVTCILSGGGRNYKLPKGTTQDTIASLCAHHGCESVMATLNAHRQVVEAADTVLVYTDGQLTDGDINTALWRSRGVDLIGAMAIGGSHRANGKEVANAYESYHKTMGKHFAKSLVANTGPELATLITQYILMRDGR